MYVLSIEPLVLFPFVSALVDSCGQCMAHTKMLRRLTDLSKMASRNGCQAVVNQIYLHSVKSLFSSYDSKKENNQAKVK